MKNKLNIWITTLFHTLLFTLIICLLSFIVKTEPNLILSYVSLVFMIISFIICLITFYYLIKV